jgi:outer membrane protein OmpA-like peptidoglycan-associated protein
MTKSVLTAAVLALIPASAFAQVTMQDYSFVQAASHVDLASVQEGQTALTDASSPVVRAFAQEMIRSHNEGHDTLAAMVTPQAKPLTTTKSPCLTWQEVLLQQKTWTPYDAAYVQATVNNQQRLVSVLQGEIQAGTDPNVKDYAQKRLPVIQGQLEEAKRLQSGGTVAVTPDTERDLFPSGGYQLSPAGERALADFAHKLGPVQAPMVIEHIMVSGYTDNQRIGPELARQGVTTNEILSEKRAESVKQYLVSQGVAANEIQTQGRGPADPVASNATAAGRAQNRRVVASVANASAGAPMAGGLGSAAGVFACWD